MAELAFVRAGGTCPFTHPLYRFSPPQQSTATEVWKQADGIDAPTIPANVDVWTEIRVSMECCNAEGVCVDPFYVGLLNCGSQPLPEPNAIGALIVCALALWWLMRRGRKDSR